MWDQLADGRFSQVVLDFLLTKDVGRQVPVVEQDDDVSAVSELEVQKWLEEQGVGAEKQDTRGELQRFLPTSDFMASTGRG